MVTTKPTPEGDKPLDVDSLDVDALGVDLGAYDEVPQRLRELNESLIESLRAAGNTALDAYEKTLERLVHFEESVSSASQLQWVSALAQAHAAFVRDTSTAYIEATRELLSGDRAPRSAEA
jgi:hypothetical protein